MIPLLKDNALPDATPAEKQNETVSNLEEPNEINESTSVNLQPLPSQARRTAAIFREYLKEVRDLSYLVKNEDTLCEALRYLTNIRRLLQGVTPKKSGISLESTKVGSKRKRFSSFAVPLRKKKDKYWAAWRGSSII